MLKNGIIFGKFYPLHIGHVDFIQQASGFVENLYVVVCSDVDRDKKLFEESRMKKMPTVKDRLRFVEKNFKHQKNIKIILWQKMESHFIQMAGNYGVKEYRKHF